LYHAETLGFLRL